MTADEHEFTLPHRHQSSRAGVRARKGALRPDEVTIAEGLPVTTAARTIADLLMIGHELEHVATIGAHAVRRDLIGGPTLEAAPLPAARRHNARDGAELLLRLLDLAGLGMGDLESLTQKLRATMMNSPAVLATDVGYGGFGGSV